MDFHFIVSPRQSHRVILGLVVNQAQGGQIGIIFTSLKLELAQLGGHHSQLHTDKPEFSFYRWKYNINFYYITKGTTAAAVWGRGSLVDRARDSW